jgi:hypothetical protein
MIKVTTTVTVARGTFMPPPPCMTRTQTISHWNQRFWVKSLKSLGAVGKPPKAPMAVAKGSRRVSTVKKSIM